jgi:hypothetical protein
LPLLSEEPATKQGPPIELLEQERPKERHTGDARESVRPWRVHERVDEDQLVDHVRVSSCERQRDGTPHRMPAERYAPEAHGRDEIDERFRESVEVVTIAAGGWFLALAESG